MKPWERNYAPTSGIMPWERDYGGTVERAPQEAVAQPENQGLFNGNPEIADIRQVGDLAASYLQGRSFSVAPKAAAAFGAGVFKAGSEAAQAIGLTPEGYDTPAYSDLYRKGVEMYTAPAQRARAEN